MLPSLTLPCPLRALVPGHCFSRLNLNLLRLGEASISCEGDGWLGSALVPLSRQPVWERRSGALHSFHWAPLGISLACQAFMHQALTPSPASLSPCSKLLHYFKMEPASGSFLTVCPCPPPLATLHSGLPSLLSSLAESSSAFRTKLRCPFREGLGPPPLCSFSAWSWLTPVVTSHR